MPKAKKTTKLSLSKMTKAKKIKKLRRTSPIKFWSMILVIIGVAVVGSYALFSFAATTSATRHDDLATADFNRMNNYRSGHGWYTFTSNSCLDGVARAHAQAEAQAGVLSDPNSTWLKNHVIACAGKSNFVSFYGANDGVGGSESAVFNLLLNYDCGHLTNIAVHAAYGNPFTVTSPNGKLTCTEAHSWHPFYVGVGVYSVVQYKITSYYICQIFVRW